MTEVLVGHSEFFPCLKPMSAVNQRTIEQAINEHHSSHCSTLQRDGKMESMFVQAVGQHLRESMHPNSTDRPGIFRFKGSMWFGQPHVCSDTSNTRVTKD